MCARCLERNLKPEKVRLLETKHKRRHRFLVLQHHIIETLNVCIALSCFSPLHFMTLSRDLFENISSATRLDNPSSFNTPPLGRETRNPSRRESSGWRHVYSIRRWFIWSGMCNLHQKWKDNCSSFLFIFTKRHFFVFRPRMLIVNVKCHKVLEWICSSADHHCQRSSGQFTNRTEGSRSKYVKIVNSLYTRSWCFHLHHQRSKQHATTSADFFFFLLLPGIAPRATL